MGKKLPPPPSGVEDMPFTDEMIAQMRPASEVVPEIVEAYRRGELQRNPARIVRGPQKAPTKVQTTLRLDADVVTHFKKDGKGWQTRLNEVLREAVFSRGESP